MPPFRIGHGYDIHRLAGGSSIRLGGVSIASDVAVVGHSDADVVLHALTDALLGAVAQPDIGQLFANTDPRWRGADSGVFVQEALRRAADAGYRVANADITIVAERPRIGPHVTAMRAAIASLLQIDAGCVGVKATTNEGVDGLGRGEAIAAWAVVLLEAPSS